ncbi:PBSX family phage terminase large subunit [Candidatus Pacearchaeota archaeon]|nr:PBSX family phage terminase large subunit [Candidatus Pacearchaeota archaeon]
MESTQLTVTAPKKLHWLFQPFPQETIVLEGGRGGGKSEVIGRKLILLALGEKTRILCTREIQDSIADSVKKVLEEIIVEMGCSKYFYITKTAITCLRTGTDFIFKGLKAGTDVKTDSIKSLKGVKYVWVEEAQTISKASLDKLTPTIREPGRKMFYTMNRQRSDDSVIQRFKDDTKARIFKINYYDNEFCPDVLIQEAIDCKRIDPHSYDHIWLGEPANDTDKGVIRRHWIKAATDLYKIKPNNEGFWFGGLDPADGGKDTSGYAMRKGLSLESITEWPHVEADEAAQRAYMKILDTVKPITALKALNYESTGIGAGSRVKLKQFKNINSVPFNPAGKVIDPEKDFVPGSKNKDHFTNLKAQQWWKLRTLLENAYKKQNQDYYVGDYITVNPDMPLMDKWKDEMCQIEWDINNSGKILIVKTPKGFSSPNLADATMICSYTPKILFIGAASV